MGGPATGTLRIGGSGGGGGGGANAANFTTIVTDDAELAAALTSDSGDTFIQAGAYTVDLDTIGALDTTPRRFLGAGRQPDGTGPFAGPGVVIEIVSTGIGLGALDFSAGLTEFEGVEFSDINFFGSAPAITSLLAGCYSVKNCNFNQGSGVSLGLSGSNNVVNCSATNPGAGGVGFFACNQLSNCTVGSTTAGSGAETGFFICEDLTNCRVFYETGAVGAGTAGFFNCLRMKNCLVDATGITAVAAATFSAATGCSKISGFTALGPTAGAVASVNGLISCNEVDGATVERFAANYNLCNRLTNCTSEQATGVGSGTHFTNCTQLISCSVDGTGDAAGTDAFFTCQVLAGCVAANMTRHGFNTCEDLAGCRADTPGDSGFVSCTDMGGCEAFDFVIFGFNLCDRLSGCSAIDTTVKNSDSGFASCNNLSGCKAVTTGNSGFDGCAQVSACEADDNANMGFDSCQKLSGCDAKNNDVNGFDNCVNVVGCETFTNAANGFNNCKHISGCFSNSDAGSRVSGNNTEFVCPYSNNFQWVVTQAIFTADQNNLDLHGHNIARLSSDALGPWTISGIAPESASHEGRFLKLVNVGANHILIGNEDANSVAANRIITSTGGPIVLAPDETLDLIYDLTTARWRVQKDLPQAVQIGTNAQQTTGSLVPVTIPGVELTPKQGTYLVTVTTSVFSDTAGERVFVGLAVAGAQQGSEVIHCSSAALEESGLSKQWIVTVDGTQLVTATFRSSAAPALANTIGQTLMTLVEVRNDE